MEAFLEMKSNFFVYLGYTRSIAIFIFRRVFMDSRVAVVAIIVEDRNSVDGVNAILHEYGTYIIGRMGIPYRDKGINLISVAIDAPQDIINALSGKVGRLKGVGAKTVLSHVVSHQE